ncbi:MAG TPA: efflux RND transporter periplasmic adaptor subunit [Polyangiaceae bacterium]|nr:efflux RND transporter periplasmic adaptor subunit [Polyangiaceae bacterium]
MTTEPASASLSKPPRAAPPAAAPAQPPAAAAPGALASRAVAELERDLSSVEGGRRWLRRAGLLTIMIALVAGVAAWRVKSRPPPPARYMTQALSQGDVVETVQSTGTVKPVTEVQVGAQVSGRIRSVLVDFNSTVKKGDVLAEIDPVTYGAQVEQMRAQLEAQKAGLARAEAGVKTTEINLERLKRLKAENLASQADVDAVQGQRDVAAAEVRQMAAQIGSTQAQITSANANLSFTRIYAPIDGVVTNRAIDPGQTVAASFQAPVLFTIAQDLSKMRVFADIDEADVGKLTEGMGAEATVDAFPGERFRGKVSQVRYNPTTVQGVVTYQAVIEVDNPERKLRPGMTATVTVRTNEVKNATRVPNAALRFKPSPEKGPDGKPVPRPPEKPLEARTGRVYLLADETPGAEKIEPRVVPVGITDGTFTALREGADLPPSAKLVTDEADDKDAKKGPRLF